MVVILNAVKNPRIGLCRCLFFLPPRRTPERELISPISANPRHSQPSPWPYSPSPSVHRGTQCLDNTAATSPATQQAYRHAIILMSSGGGAFFLATLVIFKRNP